jgi:hypothetical protein
MSIRQELIDNAEQSVWPLLALQEIQQDVTISLTSKGIGQK